jgi:hypothetical protein
MSDLRQCTSIDVLRRPDTHLQFCCYRHSAIQAGLKNGSVDYRHNRQTKYNHLKSHLYPSKNKKLPPVEKFTAIKIALGGYRDAGSGG